MSEPSGEMMIEEVEAVEDNSSDDKAGAQDVTAAANDDDEEEEEEEEKVNSEEDEDKIESTKEARKPVEDNAADEEDEEATIKSDEGFSHEDEDMEDEDDEDQTTTHNSIDETPDKIKAGKVRDAASSPSTKKGRSPSVAGLTIPFRTVKKAMKLDPDIPIVQNEAAIMVTLASELFLKKLARRSFRNAKNRGRHTIRYEDIAEARTNDKSLSFLETLLP